METYTQKINDKEAIANWEDEGGALKFQPIIKKNNHAILIGVGIFISLPFFYWLAKKI
jgi:hypothetical protein